MTLFRMKLNPKNMIAFYRAANFSVAQIGACNVIIGRLAMAIIGNVKNRKWSLAFVFEKRRDLLCINIIPTDIGDPCDIFVGKAGDLAVEDADPTRAAFSSLPLNSSCMPRQMPSIGILSSVTPDRRQIAGARKIEMVTGTRFRKQAGPLAFHEIAGKAADLAVEDADSARAKTSNTRQNQLVALHQLIGIASMVTKGQVEPFERETKGRKVARTRINQTNHRTTYPLCLGRAL